MTEATREALMPSTDEMKQATYETWEAIAPTWAKRRDFVDSVAAPIDAWLVEKLDPAPGQTLLELAAGTGPTGLKAAEVVGDEGRVIATDFSPEMLEQARSRAADEGASNIEHRVLDAQDMDLADDSADGVICRFGYMLMPDPAAALAETRRVLRSGGRLVLAVWGPPDRNPYFAFAGMALVQEGHMDPPDPAAPGIFNMADPERTQKLLQDAGFADIEIEEIPVEIAFAGVDEYLAVLADTAGPLAVVLRKLSEEQLDRVKERLSGFFEPFAAEGGYRLTGAAQGATAT